MSLRDTVAEAVTDAIINYTGRLDESDAVEIGYNAADRMLDRWIFVEPVEPHTDALGKTYFPASSDDSAARVVVYAPDRIDSDGVANPHRSPRQTVAHARALYSAVRHLDEI